ncbi:ATP-binding protein [Pseudomonas aeruginosa]|nr:ATP-binding protein [Pseudomonas aeruginosa]
MNHELKIRAKRLRLAISELLGLEIKMSQSLELVAREENYPNWDAASACAGRTSRATIELDVTGDRNTPLSLDRLFPGYGREIEHLRQITDPKSSGGALVVVGGMLGTGKTSTLHLLLNHLAEQHLGVTTLLVGLQEYPLPSTWHSRTLFGDRQSLPTLEVGTPLLARNWTEEFVVLFEVRSEAEASQAVMLAQAGYKVFTTIHCHPGRTLDAWHQFLRGVSQRLMEQLIADGRALFISKHIRSEAVA